jgi:UDP-N-acetylmuramoyl-L-alanyl-D-glutamate--2,6-diaminopimelate ligase
MMAATAEQYADVVVVTDDNPRGEKPEDIVADIMTGFTDASHARIIHDRRSAIESSISSASANDMILVAGKGHEDYQEIAGERFSYSDIDVVENHLNVGESK